MTWPKIEKPQNLDSFSTDVPTTHGKYVFDVDFLICGSRFGHKREKQELEELHSWSPRFGSTALFCRHGLVSVFCLRWDRGYSAMSLARIRVSVLFKGQFGPCFTKHIVVIVISIKIVAAQEC